MTAFPRVACVALALAFLVGCESATLRYESRPAVADEYQEPDTLIYNLGPIGVQRDSAGWILAPRNTRVFIRWEKAR